MIRRLALAVLSAATLAAVVAPGPASAYVDNGVVVPWSGPPSLSNPLPYDATADHYPQLPWFTSVSGPPAPKQYLLTAGSEGYLQGNYGQLCGVNNFPIEWLNGGDGTPPLMDQGSSRWGFQLAGVYPIHVGPNCNFAYQGTAYVLGARAKFTNAMASPDNATPPVLYNFDASSSYVVSPPKWPTTDPGPPASGAPPMTPWIAHPGWDGVKHHIVSYQWDLDGDGAWDAPPTSDPTAQASFQPGENAVSLKVTDDTGQTGTYTQILVVPKARTAAPTPTPLPDTTTNAAVVSGVPFPKVKLKVRAPRQIRVAALKRKGILVRVSGLSAGDRASARVVAGKRTIASGQRTSSSSSVAVRVKVGRKGRRLLKLKKRSTKMKVVVKVTGQDGYTGTKTASLKVSK